MLDSIKSLTDRKIIRLIEENLFEQIRYYTKSPGAVLIENESIIKFITDIPLPFFNCVLYHNLDETTLREELRSFKEYGISKSTSLLWLNSPSSLPGNIGPVLVSEGFNYDDRMIGMAADIANLNCNIKEVPGLKIEIVQSRNQLSGWVYACLKGFDENGKNFKSVYEFEESLGFESGLPWVRFTGIINDEPVATSAVFMGSSTAGLDNVTTIPEWRKRGIGALMVRHAFRFSQSCGYGVGILQASDMGLNLYRYLGFREFAELKEYIWKCGCQNNKGKTL